MRRYPVPPRLGEPCRLFKAELYALSVMSQKQYQWHCSDHATLSKTLSPFNTSCQVRKLPTAFVCSIFRKKLGKPPRLSAHSRVHLRIKRQRWSCLVARTRNKPSVRRFIWLLPIDIAGEL